MGTNLNVTDAAPRQLSDGNSQGTVLGQGTSDLIGFYNVAPVAQRSNPFQALQSNSQDGGTIFTYGTTQSPVSGGVSANSTSEASLTITGLATSMTILAVNKPTSQAGLGVGNARVASSNTLGLTFSNVTAATITPTSSEVYSVVALRSSSNLSATLTPAAVPANTAVEQQFAVTGLVPGQLVSVNKPTAQTGLNIGGCRVVSNNVLGITFVNDTASPITPTAAELYSIAALTGLSPSDNILLYGINVGTLTGTATVTTAEQNIAAAGLASSDTVIGVSKPTAQAGLGIVGARIAGTNTLAITFVNPTAATVTATANEVYSVATMRQQPAAPLKLYTPTLSPVSVAANTTAEQTFTVTGLVASSSVWLNKPSAQAGLAIMGARVSAANTLAITFANLTGTAIVPNSEQYIVGNYQAVTPSAGGYVSQPVYGNGGSITNTVNELRNSLVALGLIAGQ